MTDNKQNSLYNDAEALQKDVEAPQPAGDSFRRARSFGSKAAFSKRGPSVPSVLNTVTPELWEAQFSRNRSLSRTSARQFYLSPPVPVAPQGPLEVQVVRHTVDEGFSSDPVERDPGTPDVEFNDVSTPELMEMYTKVHVVENRNSRWRGVPQVDIDDVYPPSAIEELSDIEMSKAEYQGGKEKERDEFWRELQAKREKLKAEAEAKKKAGAADNRGYSPSSFDFLILIAILKGMVQMNLFVAFVRTVVFFLEMAYFIFTMAREAGWQKTKQFIKDRPKMHWIYDSIFLLTVFAYLVIALTFIGTVVNIFVAFLFDVTVGDRTMARGLGYGVRSFLCFAEVFAKIPYNRYKLRKRSRDLPLAYVPLATHGRGVLGLVKVDHVIRTAFLEQGKDFGWSAWLVPDVPIEIVPTPFESLQRVNQGEAFSYAIYWSKHVVVLKLDLELCERINVLTLEPLNPNPQSSPLSGLIEDGCDISPGEEVVLVEEEVEEKADMPEPVYQGPDSEFSDLMAQLDTIAGATNMPSVAVVTDVVALTLLVSKTRDKTILITQSIALLARYPKIGDFVINEIRNIIARFDGFDDSLWRNPEEPEYQAFTTGFKDSEVGIAFFEMISLFTAAGTAATLGIVDVSWIKSLQKVAIHLSAFDTLDDLMKRFLKFVKAMYEVLRKCWDAKSFAPLWQPVSMNPTRYVKLAGELMNEVLIRDSSNVVAYLAQCHKFDVDLRNGQISEKGRVEMMEELYEMGSRFDNLKRGENDQFIWQGIFSVRNALRKEIDSVRSRIELGRFKEEPYSAGLCGKPGIGKSFLVRSLQRIVAVRLKVSNSASIGFQWAVGQKFADGLTSSKRVYVFDDVDQKTGVPAYGDATPYVDFLLVRNSKPTTANMADVSDKGKFAYNALMVLWVSNKMPTYKAVRLHISDVHAFARRFNDMWMVALSPKYTREDMENGRAEDDSWVFTRYAWNPDANQDSDELFVETDDVIKSRLEFLRRTSKRFNAKIDGERAKVNNLNSEDKVVCDCCGVSMSDHFGACKEFEGGFANMSYTNPHATPMPVYQGPDDEPVGPGAADAAVAERVLREPSPLERVFLESSSCAASVTDMMTVDKAGEVVTYWIVALYLLHVLTMFWGMWFITLGLEAIVLFGSVAFMRLDEDGKVRIALMLFPKSTLTWLVAKGVVEFKMESLQRTIESLRSSTAMDRMKTFIPVMAALAVMLWLWNQSRAVYQSVKVAGEDDIVREQPKKDQWLLMENTPRNVSTPDAKTYSEVGFKRAVVSNIAQAKKGTREFPLTYVNSKTWVTNAHHLLTGAPPRYNEVSAEMVFDEEITLDITIGSYKNSFVINTKTQMAQAPGRDIVFIRIDDMVCPGAGIYKLLGGDVDVNSEYSSAELCDTTNALKPQWRKAIGLAKYRKSRSADKVMMTYDVEGGNGFGLCGSWLCAPTSSGGYLVLAAHSAGLQGLSLAEPVTRSLVESVAARLYPANGVRKETDVISYQSSLLREPGQMGPGSDLVINATFDRTHVSSAVKSGAKILALGTIKGFHARKFKTDVLEAPFKARVEAFALDRGIPTSYVSPRTLLTKKNGDIITSPFTTVLTMRDNKRGPEEALKWAVADWEKPVIEMLQETKPWRMFSYTEVFSGTDEMTPTNMRTSTGPPYNSKKANFMKKQENGDWLVEPNLAADRELLAGVLKEGMIPGVVINAAVKTEAISAQKAAECRQRILEVGPEVHSTELKRRIGFLVPIIKANKSLFEMSIGMNVYALDSERLFERLNRGLCFDGDLKMQDGKTSTQYMDEITGLILRLCEAAGMPPVVVEETRLLLLSFGDRLMCILGDVFLINGGNPTGWYGTALFASFVTILLLRSCFYLGHVESFGVSPVFTFRSEVASEVQGDDNVNCVFKESTRDWFSGKSVTKFAPLFGHVYTGTAKNSDEVEWVTVRELSYLKRSFLRIKDQEVLALELKSIAKQLMFYREPDGGSIEAQLAVNITNASRELSLHGPVVYADWFPLLVELAQSSGAGDSRFFNLLGWEETFDGVLKGTLSSLPVEDLDVSDAVYQSAEGGNLMMSVATTTDVVTPPAPMAPVIASKPISDMGAVQHRSVKVWTQTLATTDVSGTVLSAFEVVQAIKGNTQLLDVYERYYNFNFESVTIKVQHNSSASMYGTYAIVCTPSQINTGVVLANQPAIHNAHHCDYKYVFNPANNEDIEFTLPWFGCADRMLTGTSDNTGPIWYISVICLVPLADAMNSSGAAISTMTFLANYNGVQFGAPQYQGKKEGVKVGAVLQTAGMVGAAIMSVIPGAQPFVPIALGLAAGGKALAEAGHTRHRAPKLAERMIGCAVTGLGPVDGEDRGMVTDWIQAAQISTEPSVASAATTDDTMSFAYLAAKSHLVSISSITTLLASGTVLASIPVTPYISRASGSGGRCFHPFAHATAFFSYWRATMEYDVSFACNALQSGTVYAYWSSSFVTVGSVVSGDFISGAAGCIIEFDPAKSVTVKVPWMATRPLAMVDRTLVTTGSDKTRNGHLVFVVLNPLAAPYAAAISMLVTMRVGQDVVVGGTKSYRSDQDANAVPLEDQLVVQGTLTQSSVLTEECWIVASQPPTELDGVFTSSAVTSVKALCQRYCPYPGEGSGVSRSIIAVSTPASTNYFTRLSFPFYPTPPTLASSQFHFGPWPVMVTRGAGVSTFTTSSVIRFTNIGWLSPMYLGVRGGMSHKIISFPMLTGTPSSNIRTVRLVPREGIKSSTLDDKTASANQFATKGVTSNPGAAWYPLHGPGVQSEDFVTPYNSMRRFYPTCVIPSITSDESKWTNLEVESSGDYMLQIWSAGAADFSFVGFRFSPMTSNSE